MRKWEMPRGFTFLELLITLSVLGALLTFAVPSFSSVFEGNKMQRLATELTGFYNQARSEAVMRNRNLYAHISFVANDNHSVADWNLTLTDSDAVDAGNTIAVFDGSSFQGITVFHTYSSDRVSFDGIRGRAKSGTLSFFPTASTSKQIDFITANPPGRMKICGANGDLYGYKSC